MEIIDAVDGEYERFDRNKSLKHINNFLLIKRKLIELMDCCDDSDGGLSIVLSRVDENLHNACAAVYNSNDKENCNACLKMLCDEAKSKDYDFWFDAKLDLMHIAIIFFEYNSKMILKTIDSLIIQSEKDEYEYYHEKFILIKFQFLSKTKTKEVADEFIFGYVGLDGVCEFLVKRDIDECNYSDAEKLCLDKLKRTDNKRIWNNLLCEIYEKSEQFDKQLDIEFNVLLSGNSQKYDIVKELMLKLGVWNKAYANLLIKLSDRLPVHAYAEILEKEGEYEKLLDLVKRRRHLTEQCFKTLAKHYPKEAYIMYYDFILFSAKQACSRPEYQTVCKKIATLYDAGGKENAKQLIELIKNEYKRKPAFQDEINRLSKKIKI